MRSRVAARCGRIVESSWFDPLMLGIIAVNAVTLGLETYDSIDAAIGDQLRVANGVILGLFVVELLIRMGAFNLFIGIVINSMEEARAIELHRAERELLDEDDEATGRRTRSCWRSGCARCGRPSRSSSARCAPSATSAARAAIHTVQRDRHVLREVGFV